MSNDIPLLLEILKGLREDVQGLREDMKEERAEVWREINSLKKYRWKAAGAIAVINFIAGGIITYLFK